MINLFNLLPIGSMDGGRIANAISPYFGLAGLAGGAGLIYIGAISNPIFYIIMFGGAYSSATRFFGWNKNTDDDGQQTDPGAEERYYNIGLPKQATLSASYLALISVLFYGMYENNTKKKSRRQLQFEQENPEKVTKDPWKVHEFSTDDDDIFKV
jgi:Zn-dependent protease